MARVFLSLGSNLSNRADKINQAIQLLNHNHIKITCISPIYQTRPDWTKEENHEIPQINTRKRKNLVKILCNRVVKVIGDSSLWGIIMPQPDFLNCVVEGFTDYKPEKLMLTILKIEKALGRKRISGIRNLPRTIDIDILFYDDKIINESASEMKFNHEIPQINTRKRKNLVKILCNRVAKVCFSYYGGLKIPHPKLHSRAFVLMPLCDLAPDFIHPVLNRMIRDLTNIIDKKGVRLWQAKASTISV